MPTFNCSTTIVITNRITAESEDAAVDMHHRAVGAIRLSAQEIADLNVASDSIIHSMKYEGKGTTTEEA